MSSKNRGPSKGPAAPSQNQPGAKKPSAMLDLKATEVKDEKTTAAGSSQDRGSSATKPEADKPDAKSAPDAAKPQDKTKADDAAKAPETATKPGANATEGSRPSGTVPSVSAAATGSAAGSGSKPANASETKGGNGGSASKGGSGGGGSDGGGGDKPAAAAPAPAPRRSGGGFFGTLTHLAAGIIGGALVLFGAEPIEKQLGMKFTPPPQIPAEVSTRLAAVEQAAAQKPAVDLSPIQSELAAAKKQLAELAELKSQVAVLSQGQQKLEKTVAEAPAVAAGSPEAAEAVQALETRLANLETTMKTLSDATGPDGDKNALARLATISGKLSDFERTLNNQLEALRKSVMTELETRVAKTAEASAAAQAGTERIDRELATVKTNAARLTQRAETLKAANERLAGLVRAVQEQSAKMEAELDALKGDVLQQFKTVARPKDVKSALAPVSDKLTALDTQLATIVKREAARKENAQRIVLALELANLKRVLDRGGPYAAELAAVAKSSGGKVELGPLKKFASSGVPTSAELARDFQTLAFKSINAQQAGDEEPGVLNRFLSSAKSIVRVRRTNFDREDKSTEAVVARMESLLKQGNLSGAIEQSKALSKEARAPIQSWLDRLEARAGVEQAIAELERQLKASLGGSVEAPAKSGAGTGTKG